MRGWGLGVQGREEEEDGRKEGGEEDERRGDKERVQVQEVVTSSSVSSQNVPLLRLAH